MKFVEIAGRKQPVSFNMAAMLELEEYLDMPLATILTQLDSMGPSKMVKMCYLGIKYGADENDRKASMTYSGFVEYIQKDRDVLQAIMDIVVEDFKNVMIVLAEQAKFPSSESGDGDSGEKKSENPSGPTMSVA